MSSKGRKITADQKTNANNLSLLNASLQMSWKLAIVVLIPLIGGVKLDQHLNTSPWLTILGVLLAIGGVYYVLNRVLAEFNQTIKPKGTK
jgi:F0F1-type ATP synthase assembly protein I